MSAPTFRVGALSFEDKSSTSFIKHLSRAREKLLPAHLPVKADADVAGGELAVLRHLAPRNAPRALVIKRGEQIPRPSGLILNFSRAVFLHLARNADALVKHVLPYDLDRKAQPHRLGFEHSPKIRGV